MSETLLRETIRKILESPQYRLNRDLQKVTLRLIMAPQGHVPDTLTRIRVLPTVAVVGQKGTVERTEARAELDIYVKFMPLPGGVYKNLKSLSRLVSSLPGVRIVKVITFGGKKITYKGRPIVT